jgi:hypothetical protein
MDFVAIALIGIGLAVGAFGFIRLLIAAFRVNLLWCVGCIVVPVVVILFAIMHWEHAGKPVRTLAIGLAFWIAGAIATGYARA